MSNKKSTFFLLSILPNSFSLTLIYYYIGGKIDSAHHGGHAKKALHESLAFNDAVLKMDSMTNDKDTLSVVTADHSQPMIIAGYPGRGKDILGMFDHI